MPIEFNLSTLKVSIFIHVISYFSIKQIFNFHGFWLSPIPLFPPGPASASLWSNSRTALLLAWSTTLRPRRSFRKTLPRACAEENPKVPRWIIYGPLFKETAAETFFGGLFVASFGESWMLPWTHGACERDLNAFQKIQKMKQLTLQTGWVSWYPEVFSHTSRKRPGVWYLSVMA